MNFENIATAILTSSLVGLVVGYVLNRRLDAARLRLGEEIRRQADLYDAQSKLFAELLEMTYRIRNVARDLSESKSSIQIPQLSAKSVRRLKEFQEALTELLYKKRGMLPEIIFSMAHDLKQHTAMLETELDLLGHSRVPNDRAHQIYQRVSKLFTEINAIYETMIPLVQVHIGIKTMAN